MQSSLIGLFAVVAVLRNVSYSAAKHTPKSSEELSNNFHTPGYASTNFDIDMSAYLRAIDELVRDADETAHSEGDYIDADEARERAWLSQEIFSVNNVDNAPNKITSDNNNNNSNKTNSQKNNTQQTDNNNNYDNQDSATAAKRQRMHTQPADQHVPSAELPAEKAAQDAPYYGIARGADDSAKSVKAAGNTTRTTTTATATARTTATTRRTSTSSGSYAADAPATPHTKIYRPSGFVNPFGQLVAFFGSDQLHLQDYNFLFNAERHTVFQLHTSMPSAAVAPASGRVLNVVSDSIGAVLGVNAPPSSAVGGGAASSVKVEEVQLYNAASLRQSRFNPFNPTRILIHGWMGGAHAGIYQAVVPEYLKLNAGNYNVFTVDWGRGAVADYLTASYRVKPVGKVVAKFVDFLQRESGMQYEDLHVVGFSMGAHIAGIAGKFVQTGRLPVIYALDPALPFFRYENIDERVAITDADYVEVIHTSVGTYGYDWPLGHVDFYVNWGSAQPGCFLNECSHFRAYQLFAESLRAKDAFRGQGCDVKLWQDLIRQRRCLMGTGRELAMGGDPANVTALRARGGVYYLATNANAPFAKGYT